MVSFIAVAAVRQNASNIFLKIFMLIAESSGSNMREMYQVFNMGCRMEIYTSPEFSEEVIAVANKYGIEARQIGRVEESAEIKLTISLPDGETLNYGL